MVGILGVGADKRVMHSVWMHPQQQQQQQQQPEQLPSAAKDDTNNDNNKTNNNNTSNNNSMQPQDLQLAEPVCLEELVVRIRKNQTNSLNLGWRDSNFLTSSRAAAVLEKALAVNTSIRSVSIGWRHASKDLLVRVLLAIGKHCCCQLHTFRLLLLCEDWIPETALQQCLAQQTSLVTIEIQSVFVRRRPSPFLKLQYSQWRAAGGSYHHHENDKSHDVNENRKINKNNSYVSNELCNSHGMPRSNNRRRKNSSSGSSSSNSIVRKLVSSLRTSLTTSRKRTSETSSTRTNDSSNLASSMDDIVIPIQTAAEASSMAAEASSTTRQQHVQQQQEQQQCSLTATNNCTLKTKNNYNTAAAAAAATDIMDTNVVSRVIVTHLRFHANLKRLLLPDCGIDNTQAFLLADFLHARAGAGGIAELSLRGNRNLQADGYASIVQAPVLQRLDLSLTQMDADSCRAVGAALAKRPWPLQELLLCGNYRIGTDGILALFDASACPSKVVSLDLSYCDIGNHKTCLLFQTLQEQLVRTTTTTTTASRLRTLRLHGCHVNTRDAIAALADWIRHNTCVRALYLNDPKAHKQVSAAQLELLLAALRNNYELEVLQLDSFESCVAERIVWTDIHFHLNLNRAGRRILLSKPLLLPEPATAPSPAPLLLSSTTGSSSSNRRLHRSLSKKKQRSATCLFQHHQQQQGQGQRDRQSMRQRSAPSLFQPQLLEQQREQRQSILHVGRRQRSASSLVLRQEEKEEERQEQSSSSPLLLLQRQEQEEEQQAIQERRQQEEEEDWFDVLARAEQSDFNVLFWIVRQSAERIAFYARQQQH